MLRLRSQRGSDSLRIRGDDQADGVAPALV